MNSKKAYEQNLEADALFLSLGSGAISIDENGNISRINGAALEILGRSGENLLGKWFPGEIVAVNQDGEKIKPIDRAITRAMISGKPVSERTFYRHASGRIIPIHVTVSPLLVGKKPIGAVEVFNDITSEYEIDRLKSEFISIASHQLRTPATAVKNFIGLLKEGFAGELTNEQADLIEQAYNSNEHQLEIVNNLLYVARADSDQVNLRLLSHDIVPLIERCLDEQAPTLEARGQKITPALPVKLNAIFDKQFIHILLENLLTNASKYTPDGGKIKITLVDKNDFYIIKVADNGVGIAPEDMKSLFKRFSRIDNELSTIRGGSGIGLYLTKRIVDLHDGKIDVKTERGKGTEFIVTLPKEVSRG